MRQRFPSSEDKIRSGIDEASSFGHPFGGEWNSSRPSILNELRGFGLEGGPRDSSIPGGPQGDVSHLRAWMEGQKRNGLTTDEIGTMLLRMLRSNDYSGDPAYGVDNGFDKPTARRALEAILGVTNKPSETMPRAGAYSNAY